MTRMESTLSKVNKLGIDLRIDRYNLFIMFIGFFLGRVHILDRITPFGVAFLGAYIIMKKGNLGLLLSVVLGTITFQGIDGFSYYLTSLLIYGFFNLWGDTKKHTLISSAILSAIIFISIKTLETFLFHTFFIYDLFLICFEGILIFTMTYIFSFSLPIEGVGKKNFTNEKLVCSFITLALVLSGFNNLFLFGVSLKNIISLVVVIYLSYTDGVLLGVTSGIVLGMVSYISHAEMPFIISILGVGGLLAGLFNDLGKAGSVLGFILGNAIISFYINGMGTSFVDYREILISSIIFLVISGYLDKYVKELFVQDNKTKKEYEDKKMQIVQKKLSRMVGLFNSLSQTFKDTAEDSELYSSLEVYNLINEISNSTCINCPKNKDCWGPNYYSTYYKLFNLVGLMESKYSDKEKTINDLKKTCTNHIKLIDNVEKAYGLFKLNKNWSLKLKDHRLLLAEQLEGLGEIIENIKKDVHLEPIFNSELEEILFKELKNNRIDVEELFVAQLGEEDLEIVIDLNVNSYSKAGIDKSRNIVSNILGYPVTSEFTYGNLNKERRRFKLIRTNRFSSLTKVAKAPSSENNISGDNYTFGEIDNISFAAISDGMGIGKKANIESRTAIELLEKLMEVKADKEMTIKTINSVLRARTEDEIFTTLDLGFIDLYKGSIQMVKTGSPPTFIKKKDRVEVINSSSLPIGILKDVDFNIYEENLEDGDIIIMMSDGVLDSNRETLDSEMWMKNLIGSINSQNPQKIANEILEIAQFISKNQSNDDMTVLVTKVWKSI